MSLNEIEMGLRRIFEESIENCHVPVHPDSGAHKAIAVTNERGRQRLVDLLRPDRPQLSLTHQVPKFVLRDTQGRRTQSFSCHGRVTEIPRSP